MAELPKSTGAPAHQNVTFPSGGTTAHGYLALPPSGQGPGVIVIQEWWGLTDHIADVTERLAKEGKLVLAGPFDGVDGWRGMFVFAVKDIEEARQLTATDPVIVNGEMVAEYHKYFGSASLMLVNEWHNKLVKGTN